MISDAVRSEIYKTFLTGWANRTPVQLENEVYKTPDTAWTRLSMIITRAEQTTLAPIGYRQFTYEGTLFAEVFTLLGAGSKMCAENLDFAVNILQGKKIDNPTIIFTDSDAIMRGAEGAFYSGVARINFKHYEEK